MITSSVVWKFVQFYSASRKRQPGLLKGSFLNKEASEAVYQHGGPVIGVPSRAWWQKWLAQTLSSPQCLLGVVPLQGTADHEKPSRIYKACENSLPHFIVRDRCSINKGIYIDIFRDT